MLRIAILCGGLLAASISQAAGPVLVSEGELKLEASEFRYMLEHALPKRQQQALQQSRAGFDRMLQEYVLLKQMEQDAARLGLDQAPGFLARLEMHRLTSLASAVIEHQLEALPEPDFTQAARERFKAAPEPFMAPDEVRAEHILIAVDDQTSEQQAQARAREVRELVLADPSQFKQLVAQYSDDPAAKRNKGDLGYFTPDRMVKPFADAAFAMQPGEISQPVRSEFGYHIIHVLKRKPGKKLKFNDVRQQLIREERAAYYQREREKLLESYEEREALHYDAQAIEDFYHEFTATKK